MYDQASDTKVPLEWDANGNYWTFPLIEQEWAEFRGLLGRDDSGYSQIAKENYHIERSPGNEYRILWTAPSSERPGQAYGLVAVRPKPPATFLGIPLQVLIPIVTAFASAAAAFAVQTANGSFKQKPAAEVCSESQEWVPSAELGRCTSDLKAANSTNQALESCRKEEQALHDFILKRPSKDRLLYLLGRSHGQRLEAIKRLHKDEVTVRGIALQAEKAYVENVLVSDTSLLAFTKGKATGQEEAVKLLGLGELKILSGVDLKDLR